MTLTKPLQSRINRLAHRQALEHESRIKSELTQRLQQARTEGASLEVLTEMLDKLEAEATTPEAQGSPYLTNLGTGFYSCPDF